MIQGLGSEEDGATRTMHGSGLQKGDLDLGKGPNVRKYITGDREAQEKQKDGKCKRL